MAQNKNLLYCSDCRGSGKTETGHCPQCRGLGVVLSWQGKILFWGKPYDAATIALDKILIKAKVGLNIALGAFGLSGLVLMGYVGYLDNFQSFFELKYWLTPSLDKLYFWLALSASLYLYYRLEREFSKNQRLWLNKNAALESYGDWQTIWQLKSRDLLDASSLFVREAERSVQSAWELAQQFEHKIVTRAHLLAVLFQFDKSAIIFARLGINFEEWKKKFSRFLSRKIISQPGNPELSPELKATLLFACQQAAANNEQKVDLPDIVAAIAEPEKINFPFSDNVEEIITDFDLNYQKIKNVVAWIRAQEQLRANLNRYRSRSRFKPESGLDRAMTAVATPLLNKFSEDLTLQAKYGAFFPCLGRQKEFEQIFRVMEASRQGVLLVANQGVGRTAILQGLAQQMVTEDVPEILQDKRLVSVNISSLIAGVSTSQAEERLLFICREAGQAGNIVLAIENIHNLFGAAGNAGVGLDLSEVFAEIASKNQFYFIATTTPQDYVSAIENKSLGAVFQPVKVEELALNDAIQVLEARSGPIEYQNKVYFSYAAIEKAAVLSSKYIHDKYLPEKAIKILEQAAIKTRQNKGEHKIVAGEDVSAVVSDLTGIPLNQVTQSEREKLLNLEERIHERMIGQEEAVKIVCASLRRARVELRSARRPIANLLFLGPTGVGKTELAKTVSAVYFGDEKLMLRFDMSEFQDAASLSRLIGSSRQRGQLTEAVRQKPFSLVLFDEIEKAHQDILNIFLQVMDDGHLTDAQGQKIDFTNAIIVMTSNAGAQFIQDEIGRGVAIEEIQKTLINEKLREYFRPEFLNRFDGIVIFKPLTPTDLTKIARLMIVAVAKQLEERGIQFSATDEALSELAELGFDPKFGARPLRRVIQQRVDDALANYLLKGELKRRDKVVLGVGGKLEIIKAEEI